jgi:two-component system, sensor histidine kinase and response regulator
VGVVSEEGRGSTFWFTVQLPASQACAVNTRVTVQPGDLSSVAQGVRVLLAEDNSSMRGILSQLLELTGVHVDTAENGEEAVRMVKAARYDLVLMDMQMPVMGGLEATRLIRQNPVHQQLPVVALTAGGFMEDREHCFEAGMNDYLMKPFEYKDLIQVLRRNLPPTHAAHGTQSLRTV